MMVGIGVIVNDFALTKKILWSFCHAELDDSYEYSMSRHYDEANGKELRISAIPRPCVVRKDSSNNLQHQVTF